MNGVFLESHYLMVRSLKEILRIPMSLVFPILIPILQMLIFSQVFKNVASLPGFGASSYLDYQAPSVILMTVMFSAGNSAFAMILDMDSGFFEKLLLFPISRLSILLGRLWAEGVRIFFQTMLVTILIIFVMGVNNNSGFFGFFVIGVLNALFGIAYGGIFYTVALLTRNAQASQAMFPITFPLLFLSTALMPKELLPEWLKTVASINPVSHVIEAYRSVLLANNPDQVLVAFGITGILGILTLATSFLAFRKLVR